LLERLPQEEFDKGLEYAAAIVLRSLGNNVTIPQTPAFITVGKAKTTEPIQEVNSNHIELRCAHCGHSIKLAVTALS
jgi:hypothetical protein